MRDIVCSALLSHPVARLKTTITLPKSCLGFTHRKANRDAKATSRTSEPLPGFATAMGQIPAETPRFFRWTKLKRVTFSRDVLYCPRAHPKITCKTSMELALLLEGDVISHK